MTKDEELKVLADIRAALMEANVEEVRGALRMIKELKLPVGWQDYGADLMSMYLSAIRQEMGDEAANEFVSGVLAKISN